MSASNLSGLCLNCAVALAGSAPKEPQIVSFPYRREWSYDAQGKLRSLNPDEWGDATLRDEYMAAWAHHDALSKQWSVEIAQWRTKCQTLWLSWPRCEECPTFSIEEMHRRRNYSVPLFAHLCGGCTGEAREEADSRFAALLPVRAAEHRMTEEEENAGWISLQAESLVHDAWRSTILSWPRCENCPGATQAQGLKEAQGVGERVLEVLAMQGQPLNSGDLVGGVKGLTKNTVGGVMRRLVEDGRVEVTRRGPAKFYGLP